MQKGELTIHVFDERFTMFLGLLGEENFENMKNAPFYEGLPMERFGIVVQPFTSIDTMRISLSIRDPKIEESEPKEDPKEEPEEYPKEDPGEDFEVG